MCQLCSEDATCAGVSLTTDHLCYHHLHCQNQVFACDGGDSLFVYDKLSNSILQDLPLIGMSTRNSFDTCGHSGVYDQTAQVCTCQGGWIGELCDERAVSCQELLGVPGYGDGYHWVDMGLFGMTDVVKVVCRIMGNSAMTLIMSNTGDYDNAKSWNEYVHGFYHDDNNFWIGLENMKNLFDTGHNTEVLGTTFDYLGEMNVFEHTYLLVYLMGSEYSITHVEAGGTIQLSGSHSIFGLVNCLSSLMNSVPFSTWDTDYDRNTHNNCAEEAGVGWWFPVTCSTPCNPMGRNYQTLPGPKTRKHMDMFGIDFADSASYTNITSYMYIAGPA